MRKFSPRKVSTFSGQLRRDSWGVKRCFLNTHWKGLEMSLSTSKWQMLPLWRGWGESAPCFQAGTPCSYCCLWSWRCCLEPGASWEYPRKAPKKEMLANYKAWLLFGWPVCVNPSPSCVSFHPGAAGTYCNYANHAGWAAGREGAPLPNSFPLLEQLVVCLSPQTGRGEASGQGQAGLGLCGASCPRAARSTWFAGREGSRTAAKDGSPGQRDFCWIHWGLYSGLALGSVWKRQIFIDDLHLVFDGDGSSSSPLPPHLLLPVPSSLFISSFLNLQAHNVLLLAWDLLAGKFMI